MRVLHIAKYFPPASGGMERFLADLVRAQQRAGHEVSVLVHAHAGRGAAQDPPWLMRCPVWLRLIFAPISPLFPFWLARAIRQRAPDVLHIHMPNVSPFWALMLPRARRIPWVVHWHSDVEPSKYKLALRLAYPHYQIFERALLERAECIIVTSPQYLEASRPLRPWRQKCQVVPLGIDAERLPENPASPARETWKGPAMRVLAVGRLSYYKGFETLVRAVARDPAMQLLLAGSGEEEGALARLVGELGRPPGVRLLGEVDDAMLCHLMATCDVLCLPSRERTEAFGLVLLEAMRYGKPVVVSDLAGSGVTFVARDGRNAVLVPPEDVEAWHAALAALAREPERRQLLGRAGRERCDREFDIARVERRIGVIYRSLMLKADDTAARAALRGDIAAADGHEARAGRLLVVIPALNEAADIGEVVSKARAHGAIDVLVIDDGSTDDTAAIATLNGATVVHAPLWQGAWGAIQTGIRFAVRHGYSAVVTMDGDGQHEPDHLPLLMEAARDADVVIAACPERGSRQRRIAWAYFRFLTGLRFEDLTSGFRYYNARACRLLAGEEATLLDYQDLGVLLLLRRARLRIAEISVAMNPRRHGASRVFSSWWTVARYMSETTLLCLARWNQSPRKASTTPHPVSE